MKTAREIVAAFQRGELTPSEADKRLLHWDDERVDLEVADLLEHGGEPTGHFPAALWDRYWGQRILAVIGELQLSGWKFLIDDPGPNGRVPRDTWTISKIRSELRARRIPDCKIELDLGRKVINCWPPPLPEPLAKFAVSVRQVPE